MEAEAVDRYGRYFPYVESSLEVVFVDGQLRAVSFPEEPHPDAGQEHDLLDRIDRYLSGTSEDEFRDVPIDVDVPPAERAVLDAVRDLPYGKNASVLDIARSVPEYDAGTDDDIEAIRQILDRNPVPVVVPDHRVRDGPSATPPRVEQRLRSLEQLVA